MARSWGRTLSCSLVVVGCGLVVYAWPRGVAPQEVALAELAGRAEAVATPAVAAGPFAAELDALGERASRALGDPAAGLARTTAPDAADDEWRRLPRTDDAPPFLLALGPAAFTAARLYRNVHLNPGDRYLDREQRAALHELVRVSDELLLDLERIEMRATVAEGESALARGLCQWLDSPAIPLESVPAHVRGEFESLLQTSGLAGTAVPPQVRAMPPADGRRFVRKFDGDRVGVVPVAAMPSVVACRQLRRGLITDLGLRLLAAFSTFGVLPDDAASAMAQAFVRECEEMGR